MIQTRSMARRLAIGALVAVVLASAGACGSKSVVDNFTSKITASDFQASGAMTGTVSVAAAGQKFDGTANGTFKMKGSDSASSLSMSIAGSTTTNDSVDLGNDTYTRSNGGSWTKGPRKTDSGLNMKTLIGSGLTDKGVETHNGKQLHHLVPNKAPDAKTLWGADSPMSAGTFTVDFWATDDGSPAAMTISGGWTQDMSGTSAEGTIALDMSFDSLSGVTIEAPSM